ncbi:MAG: hypothetical protein IJW67_12980 [Blautia sp.]|nr:hypothetical protein [Blautia sp.]
MEDLNLKLDELLKSYHAYYNVNTENPSAPFDASAEFFLHDEQYFLLKSAKISEADSREYVYFAVRETLDLDTCKHLDEAAWETGLSRVEPKPNHRNSDIILVILTNEIREDAASYLKKLRRYKSYRMGLYGWSAYRVIACEPFSGKMVHNRQGQTLEKVLGNIIPS